MLQLPREEATAEAVGVTRLRVEVWEPPQGQTVLVRVTVTVTRGGAVAEGPVETPEAPEDPVEVGTGAEITGEDEAEPVTTGEEIAGVEVSVSQGVEVAVPVGVGVATG